MGRKDTSTISGPSRKTTAGSYPEAFSAEKNLTDSPVIITVTEPPMAEINRYSLTLNEIG